MAEIKMFRVAGEPLLIGDKITLELYRGHRGYYLDTPDDAGEAFDLVVNTGRTFLARRIAGGDIQSPTTGSKRSWITRTVRIRPVPRWPGWRSARGRLPPH